MFLINLLLLDITYLLLGLLPGEGGYRLCYQSIIIKLLNKKKIKKIVFFIYYIFTNSRDVQVFY